MRVLSLCSGYGGLDLAVQAVFPEAHPVAFAEYEAAPSKVLAHHWPDVPNLHDITAVDWDSVGADILTAGYPCQPFSMAGARKGTDDHRHLWPFVAEAVRRTRPRLVLLENVAGHRSMGFGDVLGDLAALGYVGGWRSVRASDVGAPHQRERVFILAVDDADDAGRGEPGRPVAARPEHAAAGCRGDATAADTACAERRAAESNDLGTPAGRAAELGECVSQVAWGAYEPAIRRWERVLGRSAPAPTELGPKGGARLSPYLVEWMMGLPAGHVTAVPGLSRNEQLKMLGNGVVPQQAAFALRLLVDDLALVAA